MDEHVKTHTSSANTLQSTNAMRLVLWLSLGNAFNNDPSGAGLRKLAVNDTVNGLLQFLPLLASWQTAKSANVINKPP
tara:strand:- start:100 stop:333 length:234 start_codon:yes stop_codon:yes gene_type:complete